MILVGGLIILLYCYTFVVERRADGILLMLDIRLTQVTAAELVFALVAGFG